MSLLTLPRFEAGVGRALTPLVARSCQRATSAARARVTRAATAALRRGQIAPQDVVAALGEADGDAGMAALLRRSVPLPQRPRLTAQSLALQAFDAAPGSHVRVPLAELMQVLADGGDLSPEDCRFIASPASSFGALIRRVNGAWNRRCERLTAPIRALLPAELPLLPSYLVMPGALLAVLSPGVYTHPPYDSEREADEPSDVYVCATGRLVVPSNVTHLDPDARAALHCAWNAIVTAVRSPLMESAENGLGTLVGYAEELLRDAALGCTWEGNTPVIADESLHELGQEIGIDTDDDAMREGMRAFLAYTRSTETASRWSPKAKAFTGWLATNAATPLGRIVTTLLALAKVARTGPRVDPDTIKRDYSDEGLLPVCLLPQETGLDGYFEYVIDQNYQSCGDAELMVTRDDPEATSLGALLDRHVIDAAIVAAAATLIDPPTPRSPSPSEDDDDANENDEDQWDD